MFLNFICAMLWCLEFYLYNVEMSSSYTCMILRVILVYRRDVFELYLYNAKMSSSYTSITLRRLRVMLLQRWDLFELDLYKAEMSSQRCRQELTPKKVGWLVGLCFKPTQPQRTISGLRETFIKIYVVERTSKAKISWEEQCEKVESCRENLWNEIQLKGP